MTTEKKRLRVGVLFGGRSGEHEVSLISAASVIQALDPAKYEAVPIGITKDGRWLAGTAAHKMLPPVLSEVLRSGDRVMLSADPNVAALVPVSDSRADALRVDVVFPVLHGTYGEDGTVQGLLDLAGLPYVGSGVLGSAVGMDKDMQKRLFLQAKLPVGDFLAIPRAEWEKSRAQSSSRDPQEIPLPGFRQARDAGQFRGHDQGARRQGTGRRDGFCRRVRAENSGRAHHPRPRNRTFRSGQRKSESVHSRRDRAAPRILRLHGKISRRRHAPADSRETYDARRSNAFRNMPSAPSARSNAWAWRAWIFSSRTAPAGSC